MFSITSTMESTSSESITIVDIKQNMEEFTSQLIKQFTDVEARNCSTHLSQMNEMKQLSETNQALVKQLEVKQTELTQLETEIQKLKDKAVEETSENKFDIIRSQAKEISCKDKEIMRLTQELVKLKEPKLKMVVKPTGWSPTSSSTPRPASPTALDLECEKEESVVNDTAVNDTAVDDTHEDDTTVDNEGTTGVVEQEVKNDDENDEDDEDDDDDEDELFSIKYRKVNYYRDSNNKVYECLEDDEPGECIGDWVKQASGKYKLVKH